MVTTNAMLDTTLELPNITAPIRASLSSNTVTLPSKPLSHIHIPRIKPVNPKPMPQPLPILPPVPTPSRPTLYPTPIILAINPVPLIPPVHKVIVHPTPVTLPLVKLALVEVPVAVKFNPFQHNRLVLLVAQVGLADKPLDGLVLAGFRRKPVSLLALVAHLFDNHEAMVDQTLVLPGQEQGHGDENQGYQEVFRGGYFVLSQEEEEGVEGEGGGGEGRDEPGFLLPGTDRGGWAGLVVGLLLLYVRFLILCDLVHGGQAVD